MNLKSISLVDKLPTPQVPNDRWHALEYLFWVLPFVAYFLLPNYLVLISQIMILALFALSLDLILGYSGIVSLGHAAFFGIGAYTSGLLSTHGWGEPFSALLVAAAVAAVLGYLTSFLIVRGHELTQLMVTLGVGLMLYEAANKATDLTGGADGLWGVTTWPLFGVFEIDLFGKTGFFYSYAILLIMFLFARRLMSSTFGLSLMGIREGTKRMPAIGANVDRRLVAVYTISAAMAGIAGALLAQTTQFVSLDVLSFARSADLLIILVLGGTGRLYGAMIGAVVFMVAHHQISDINPVYWQFWIGLLLIVIVMAGRGGIIGVVERIIERRRERKAGGHQ
jgi:branched-chain amino acid transport system permease protein